MFEGGLLDGGGAEKVAEPVETDLLGDIELQKNVNGARECKGLRHELDLIQHSVKDIAAHRDEKEAGLFGERVETKPRLKPNCGIPVPVVYCSLRKCLAGRWPRIRPFSRFNSCSKSLCVVIFINC